MYSRRTVLAASSICLTAIAGCTGSSAEDPTQTSTEGATPEPDSAGSASSEVGMQPETESPDSPSGTSADTYSERSMPDPMESDFQSAADEFLVDKAAEPNEGAIYLEIINEVGTEYYATDVHTELTEAVVNVNGMLVFKTGGMNPHTFGIHDPFTTGPRPCVDDVEDESTSGYDVFGFNQQGAPNSLKPFANDQCSFEVSEADGVFTGLGAAKAHFYTITDGYHGRLMRFKYVYRK